jgi:Zn-dependent M16 (insulinase) family peptidase
MGTKSESFVQLQQRIGAQTGGISVSAFTSDVRGSKEPVSYVVVRGKATSARSGELFGLFTDILLTARLDDQARFKQMAAEAKASMEARAIGGGHSLASTRLGGQLSAAGWADELMGGFTALQFVRDLVKRCDSDWASVQADLEAIRAALLARQGAVLNLTGDEKTLSKAHARGADFLAALPAASGAASTSWASAAAAAAVARGNELLTVPTQVNYVAKAVDLYASGGYTLHGSCHVINKLISTSWLWDRVRVSGGAYGGFCDFDSHSGQFTYLSYRDPNLLKTLDTYDGTPDFLRQLALDEDALTKAIIGTIGDVDSYQLPDAKGYTALMRHVLRVSDAERQQRREEILGTTVKDFRAFAEVLEHARGPAARVAAVASADAAAAAAAERPELGFKVLPVM